jgi:ribosomal protein S18 acetylase RimI-like enzyme
MVRRVEPRELPRSGFAEAAQVMADAFLDDPGWMAAGPDDPRRRHACIRRTGLGILKVVARWGGPAWHVERDGRIAGVLTTLDPGQWPPPALRAMVLQAPGPLLAGPSALRRCLQSDSVMHRTHPSEPHVYVWTLTVAPAFQRQGVGRALLAAAFERSAEHGVPTYLETANPDNLPYYGSLGFAEVGEHALPRGARLWLMQRAVR